ncbi:MAG: pyruvate kinase [Legionellales bacterium]|nr:pyruvate kinase [Legionellales bacterium]
MEKRTKIIATLGPSTDDPGVLSDLIASGVDVVRLNFSHGDVASHRRRVQNVRMCAQSQNRVIGILADLQGPKIRIGAFQSGSVMLTEGQAFRLDSRCEKAQGDESGVFLDYSALADQVNIHQQLSLSDGKIILSVTACSPGVVDTIVITGGELKDHQGINLVGGGLASGALTDKDRSDLSIACELCVDYIALSFVKDAQDILQAKALIQSSRSEAHVIAKIERLEALSHIESILNVSDGLMVARGDLAVEVGDAEVPAIQKQLIHQAKAAAKPVIVATQMMESMIHASTPTRAEVSDVANAVLEGADAVMLSAESATGAHPVGAVNAMVRVCLAAESHQPTRSKLLMDKELSRTDEAVATAAIFTANRLDIQAIVALTESGRTALWMSSIQTKMPIYALSRHDRTLGQLALYRGVHPIYFDVMPLNVHVLGEQVIEALKAQGWLHVGHRVILTQGDHLGESGGSNTMKVLDVA